MRSWQTPTPEKVSRPVALMVRAEQRRYFFDTLQNPAWLKPLDSKGFFKDPPAAIRDNEKGTVGFPPWPEGAYLARMAALAPTDVLEIVQRVPESDNERVHEHLVDAALAMPPKLAGKLASRVRKWVQAPRVLLLHDKAGKLIAYLAGGGEVDAALRLARTLLAVHPDRRHESVDSDEEAEYRPPPRAVGRFDDWEYGEIIRRDVSVLVEAAGERALKLLCDQLQAAVTISLTNGAEAKPYDISFVWRPAIEEHAQNGRRDVRNILVSAVRDASVAVVRSNPDLLTNIVESLEGRSWLIFRRMALHLLGAFPDMAPEIVASRLTDRSLFDETGFKHEYATLLRTAFTSLTDQQQTTILGWIEWGPDLARKGTRQTGTEQSSEDQGERDIRYAQVWARDRLAWIGNSLPPDWAARYRDLVDAFGEPQHPDFASWSSGGWVGPNSPKTVDELRTMAAVDVVRYMRRWKPATDELWDPSPEGLGRSLSTVVAERPRPYALVAQDFYGLDPTYVRALLSGLREAIKEGRNFEWRPVVELCRRVVTAPWLIEPGVSQELDRDSTWSPSNQSIAELLSVGFEDRPGSIPTELRSDVWQILLGLMEDPDPDQAYEREYGGSNMDPLTLSINTVRGEAMHAVVRYALWLRRATDQQVESTHQMMDVNGKYSLPDEVISVLDRHLDPIADPSLAVRAVYGQWLPWLAMLDESWVRTRLAQILPSSMTERPYWDAAWETYLTYSRLFVDTFDILRPEYERALGRMRTWDAGVRRRTDPDDRLAEHLMVLYWWGRLELNEVGGLITVFYERAPLGVRRHALDFIGWSLPKPGDSLEPEISERLRTLWEWRLKEISEKSSEEASQELGAFGWWFASGAFDVDWAVAQLLAALRLGARLEAAHQVIDEVAKIAYAKPLEAVECLRLFAESDREGWVIYASREAARVILATATAGTDETARTQALALIDWFGMRGLGAFRDLR